MGGDGQDDRVFATLNNIRDHSTGLWWLYLSKCRACEQEWLFAQDDRIYDNFYLKRLDLAEAYHLLEGGHWPDDFISYERVLRLGRTLSQAWTFLDPRSPALVATAEDLRKERPDITVEEIAHLLAIEPKAADRVLGS